MNEIIQSLEANATNGKENFCQISENMLNAMKVLSTKEETDKLLLQSQLDIANKKLDKIKEHVENSKFYYKDEDSEEIYEDYYPSATDILSIIGE